MPPKVKNNEDLITTSQVCDLLEQQRFFYKDLIQQQEGAYKGFMHMLMNSLKKRFDGILKGLCHYKSSIQHNQKDVNELKSLPVNLSNQCKELHSDIKEVSLNLNMNEKNNFLKNQFHCNNLIFEGIPETEIRSGLTLREKKIRKMIEKSWNLTTSL